MELTLFLLKGILIGLLFGVPVGAVGAMTIQRTLEHGVKAGLITGGGASAGAFGLTLVSDLLLKYQTAVTVIGGGFIVAMGICSFAGKPHRRSDPQKGYAGMTVLDGSLIGEV